MPCSPALAPLFMSMPPVDDAVPETFTLSTTLRLPAKDCAIRLASSRSFCEGAVPLSVMLSAETSTEMLLLVSVGSFLNAVWMSLFTWAEDSAAPVVPAVELVCGAGAATELLGEVLAEALAPVVELVLACPATLPLAGDCALASEEALGFWGVLSAEGVLAVADGCALGALGAGALDCAISFV